LIIAAFRKRDPDEAELRMRQHLIRQGESLMEEDTDE